MESIKLENNIVENAKILTSKIENKSLRIRAYALNLAAGATAQYLSEKGLTPDNSSNLYKVSSFIQKFELADIYIDGFSFDVRVSFDGKIFTIPKAHKKYGVNPLAYIVVKFDDVFENIEFLGYFSDDYENNKSDDEYYYIETQLLKPIEEISDLIENSTPTIYPYSASCYEKVRELSVPFIDDEISDDDKTFFIKQVISCSVCRETFCDVNDFDCVVSHIKNYQELLNDSTLTVLSGNQKELEFAMYELNDDEPEGVILSDEENTDEQVTEIEKHVSDVAEEPVVIGNFEENFDEIDAFVAAPVNIGEEDFSTIDSEEDSIESNDLEFQLQQDEEEQILDLVQEEADLQEISEEIASDKESLLDNIDSIESLSNDDEEVLSIHDDEYLEDSDLDEIDLLNEQDEVLLTDDEEIRQDSENIVEAKQGKDVVTDDRINEDNKFSEPIELLGDGERPIEEVEPISQYDSEENEADELMSLVSESDFQDVEESVGSFELNDDVVLNEEQKDFVKDVDEFFADTDMETVVSQENNENIQDNIDESLESQDNTNQVTEEIEKPVEEIESLFENEIPSDSEQSFELAQEPINEEIVKKTKRLAVMAGLLVVLIAAGGTMFVMNKQKAMQNSDLQGSEMFDFSSNSNDNLAQESPVAQDINRSMTNSFSDKPTAITVTKLAWQVSEKLALENSVKEYLQIAGKNIQMNLQNDLASSTDVVLNNLVKVSISIAPDNTLKGIQILESSGTDKIDEVILTSIKNTIKYVNVPKLKDYKSDYFLTLIINF